MTVITILAFTAAADSTDDVVRQMDAYRREESGVL